MPAGDSAAVLWQRAREAGWAGRPAVAVRLCEAALKRVRTSDTQLRARILMTTAYQRSELGDIRLALSLLDTAEQALGELRGPAQSARGALFLRIGRHSAAVGEMSRALQTLGIGDSLDRVMTLMNRGSALMAVGELASARADTYAAARMAAALGNQTLEFMARHNLGYIRYLEGDLPGALDDMAKASEIAPEESLGVPALDRARVLAAAGLFSEAREAAGRALDTFTANRATGDLVDALLLSSELALFTGDYSVAKRVAGRAQRLSERRANHPAALLGELLALRADTRARDRNPPTGARGTAAAAADADRARSLSDDLAQVGLDDFADTARLLGAEALVAAGRTVEAVAMAARAGPAKRRELAAQLHRRLVAGKLALAQDDRRRALAEIRRGLDDLSLFQARFGSQDLQAAGAVHGRALARLGLRTAVETGSPSTILQWLERSRAVTTRLPAVRPSADPDLAADLGALRQAARAAREAMLSGRPDPALERDIVRIRSRIRARAWTAGGKGRPARPASLTAVQRALRLEPSARVLAWFHGAGLVHALVLSARQANYRRLGSQLAVDELLRKVHADLDLLAGSGVNSSVRQVARRSLTSALGTLAALLVEPLADLLGEGPIRLAASGELATAPWALVPGLMGRPLTVSQSVTAAMVGADGEASHERGVLAVVGPDVRGGHAEVLAVANQHPGTTVLTGADATGRAVLDQVTHGGLLHIAAHGHHVPESPLFSSVLLADGPLFGYDIAPNHALPAHVVLSCCDVGQHTERPGGEPLGLAAALLRSGVQTVIAGTCRVADDTAAKVMAEYHRLLAAGQRPAAALAGALTAADGEPAPFACLGAGF